MSISSRLADYPTWINCIFIFLCLTECFVYVDGQQDCSSSSTSASVSGSYAYCSSGEFLCDPYANKDDRGCDVSIFFHLFARSPSSVFFFSFTFTFVKDVVLVCVYIYIIISCLILSILCALLIA